MKGLLIAIIILSILILFFIVKEIVGGIKKYIDENAELRECPFCGNTDVHITEAWPHYVYCTRCGVMLQLRGHTHEEDIPLIKKIWNSRV